MNYFIQKNEASKHNTQPHHDPLVCTCPSTGLLATILRIAPRRSLKAGHLPGSLPGRYQVLTRYQVSGHFNNVNCALVRPLGRDPYPAYSTIQPSPMWQHSETPSNHLIIIIVNSIKGSFKGV